MSAPLKNLRTQAEFAFQLGKKSRGFTLIELLVVIAIVGILTTIAVSSYNTFNKNQTVRIAALDLKSDLRASKTDASAGKKAPDCSVDSDSDGRADYSLIGHFLTFEVGSDTFSGGQRCSANGAYSPNPLVVNTLSGKKLSQGAIVEAIDALDNTDTSCHPFSSGQRVTIEYYTVAVTDPSGLPSSTLAEPNTAFYDGSVVSGSTPIKSDNCLSPTEGLRLTVKGSTAKRYYLFVKNNGNVYERVP